MLDVACQVGILIFGPLAIFLMSCKDDKMRRWGYISGLCSQPWWFITTYTHEQWGIFVLSFFYSFSWARGVYNFWILPFKNKGKYI